MTQNTEYALRGQYITASKGNEPVHFMPDPRTPRTACGLDFAGKFATKHSILTGGAFGCDPCKAAWEAAQIDRSGTEDT